MYSPRSQILALALLMLCTLAALVLAGVVALSMTLTAPLAIGALGLSAVLVAGVVLLHRRLREARWDAGYRLH
jgi:hypothetical protein